MCLIGAATTDIDIDIEATALWQLSLRGNGWEVIFDSEICRGFVFGSPACGLRYVAWNGDVALHVGAMASVS